MKREKIRRILSVRYVETERVKKRATEKERGRDELVNHINECAAN